MGLSRRALLVLGSILGIALTSVCATVIFSPAAGAANRMEIHEVYFDSPGSDTGSNSSLNHEWVQLHNRSSSRITLTGWTLRDAQGHVYRFGGYTIRAHGYVKVHTGRGGNTQTDRYWGRRWYIWNNTGDTATVRDGGGALIDRCSFNGGGSYKIC